MARFVLTTLGSLGDLYPIVAVARSLVRFGQQAVVAAAGEYRQAVEEAGVGFAPVRPGFAEFGDYRSLVAKAFDVYRGPEFLIRRVILPSLRQSYADLWQAAEGADFLVSHPLTFAMPLVAEKRRLPWAAAVLSPMSFVSCYDFPSIPSVCWLDRFRRLGPRFYRMVFGLVKLLLWRWERPIRELRRELSLPKKFQPAMFEGQFSPLLNLALFDRQLAEPQPDWPGNVEICGAPLYDGPGLERKIEDDLTDYLASGEMPLVFALGSSVAWLAGDFWQKAAAAAVGLGCRALLITGSDRPSPLPEGVRAYSSIPYSRIFPAASAIIHQAGIGTLARALRSGHPQLIVPLAFDQPDNARRAARLGLARVLPFARVTTEALINELQVVLTEPRYLEQSRQTAREVSATAGADQAAASLVNALSHS